MFWTTRIKLLKDQNGICLFVPSGYRDVRNYYTGGEPKKNFLGYQLNYKNKEGLCINCKLI